MRACLMSLYCRRLGVGVACTAHEGRSGLHAYEREVGV